MKWTAERKRLAFLIGFLVLAGGYSLYTNVLSGPSSSSPSQSSRAAAKISVGLSTGREPSYSEAPPPSHRAAPVRTSEEFRPSLKPKRPEDRVDPMTIDPTLRLDLLAKVQAVSIEGGRRNLFAVGAAPLPPEPLVALKSAKAQQATFGPQPKPAPPAPPAPPPPPPITLKYYGYSSARGDNRKHAFFLDGDDILVAAEGETVKKRYRVVRIGVNSVVMEDTQFKHEQTLPLQEEAAG
jgi:hypothetical protein